MPTAQFSSEELVQALRRSHLPTIVVEGRDDMLVYRWLENQPTSNIDILPCGGRSILLQVFLRRTEFAHLPCAFVADKDMWLFASIPQDYQDIIFTEGYSIENDLLDGSSIPQLLSESEKGEFCELCELLSLWFAFEVEQEMQGLDSNVSLHPNQLVPRGSKAIDHTALSPRTFKEPDPGLVQQIQNSFHLLFRGKSLVEVYARILSTPGRFSRFSAHNIIELCAKLDSTPHTQLLMQKVCRKIQVISPII